jgi:hypothetical protein
MTTFSKDTPMDRPNPGGRAAIFVPLADAEQFVAAGIKSGSGVVGFGNTDGSLMVYFENNRFNDPALHAWQSKIFKAYDRMVNGSPTTSKLSCDAGNMLQIGFIQGPEILVRDMAALTDWLARSDALDTAPAGPEIHA